MDNLSAGWARLSDLRRALLNFRKSGKPIYGFVANGGNAEYYLASACDRIFMPPAASLHLVGLASEVFFFRDVLDRLGLEPQLQSVGEFKSAGEMITRTGMSGPAREQLEALLDDFNHEFCTALAGGRGLDPQDMAAVDQLGPVRRTRSSESGADRRCLLRRRTRGQTQRDSRNPRRMCRIRALPGARRFRQKAAHLEAAAYRHHRCARHHRRRGNPPRPRGRHVAGAQTLRGL